MRKYTEHSGNIRGMARSAAGWGDRVHDSAIGGGNNKMMPNALAVLAAAEAGFMFLLVKLSGCRTEESPHEPEDVTAVVPGEHHQAEA